MNAKIKISFWKYLEFSNQPLNVRFGERGRRLDLSWQKKFDRLNKCLS